MRDDKSVMAAAGPAIWKAEALIKRFTRLPTELAQEFNLQGAVVTDVSWNGTVLQIDGWQPKRGDHTLRREFTIYAYADAALSATGQTCWATASRWQADD